MTLRTAQSLQRLYQESKQRQKKKKEAFKQKYINAREAVKKELADKLSTKQEKTNTLTQKTALNEEKQLPIEPYIYRSKYVERFSSDEDLYTTIEELKEACPHCIDWDFWKYLVTNTRKIIEVDNHPPSKRKPTC